MDYTVTTSETAKLWPNLWHMEIPRPGSESEPQLQTTLHLQQHGSFNPLHQVSNAHLHRGWAIVIAFLTHCATAETPCQTYLFIYLYSFSFLWAMYKSWFAPHPHQYVVLSVFLILAILMCVP